MPRNLSDSFLSKLSAQSIRPIELISITYKDIFLLNRTKQFAIWPTDIILDRLIFKSFPYVAIDDYSIGLEDHPTTTITFLDVDSQFRTEFRDAQNSYAQYPDLRNADITVWKILANHLTSSADVIKDTFKISDFSADDEFVQLKTDTLFQNPNHSFPPRVYSRRTCQFIFRDPLTCGWINGQGGDSQSCDHSLAENNGCAAHKNTSRVGMYPSISDEAITANGL
jgi:hypothetical protein